MSIHRDSAAPTQRNGDIQEYFNAVRDASSAPKSSVVARAGSVLHANSKLPKINIVGLTPSQRIFSIATGLDPQSLSVSSGDEFFLFVNLRAEHKWASYSMTPSKWVEAATVYNTELEKLNRSLSHFKWITHKTPRALMDKLSEVEGMVLRRLAAGDYKCTFFTPACGRDAWNMSNTSSQRRKLARKSSGESIATQCRCSREEAAILQRYARDL